MKIWQLEIVAGPLPWIVYGIAVALLVVLVVRRWSMRSFVAALIGAFLGALVAGTVWFVANRMLWFGDPLPHEVAFWAIGALAACGFAVGGFVGARVWRKVVAVVAIVAFLLAAAIGINAFYGIDETLGDLFGVSSVDRIDLPDTPIATPDSTSDVPLYESWTPPAGMPTAGAVGSQAIPGTVSGFPARDPDYVSAAQTVSGAAQAAGMTVANYVVPDADHGMSGLIGGLEESFSILYPVLGLSAR